jgi:hypothetical protein
MAPRKHANWSLEGEWVVHCPSQVPGEGGAGDGMDSICHINPKYGFREPLMQLLASPV